MNSQHHFTIRLVLLLVGAFLLAGCGGESESNSQTQLVGGNPGNLAPDFELTNLAGDTVKLSDLRGDVVLVDFWATWCGPCKMAMPHLQDIHEQFGDKGVTIVAISVDRQGERVVRPFIQKYGYSFDVVMTDNLIEQKFGGFRGIPTTFIIAPDGTVFKRWTGYQSKAAFLNAIKQLKPELAS